MEISKLTAKGQTTIPVGLRKELGLKPGDKILFMKNAQGETVMSRLTADQQNQYRELSGFASFEEEWLSAEDEEAFRHLQNPPAGED